VNLLIPLPEFDPLYVFLPLALAGFVTFALSSLQWLAQFFAHHDRGSK
jgi:hypothetical protein